MRRFGRSAKKPGESMGKEVEVALDRRFILCVREGVPFGGVRTSGQPHAKTTTLSVSKICVLSAEEYLALIERGIRPSCEAHRHETEARARQLIAYGLALPCDSFSILGWGPNSQRTLGKDPRNGKSRWRVINRWSLPTLQLVDY